MFYKIQHNQHGQSLLELMVALGVFVMAVSSIMFLVLDSQASNQQGLDRLRATLYAEESIEAVQSISRQGWNNLTLGAHGLSHVSGGWQFSGNEDSSDIYKRRIIVEPVERDSSGLIVDSGGTIDFDTKKITTSISWDITPQRPGRVSLVSYVTNWQAREWWQTTENDFSGGTFTNTTVVTAGDDAIQLTSDTDGTFGNEFIVSKIDTAGGLRRSNQAESMRFTASQKGTIESVRIYVDRVVGTSPTYRVGLQGDQVGNPSGRWLGSGQSGYGALRPGTAGWQTIKLGEPVVVLSGTVYHLVVQWQSGTIDNRHYISLRSSTPNNKSFPFNQQPDAAAAVQWSSNGNRWLNTTLQPIYEIMYSDASQQGNPYTDYNELPIYGGFYAGEEFVPTSERTVSAISLYVKKNNNRKPADDLYVIITDVMSGKPLAQGTLVSASMVTRDFNWYTLAFSVSQTFQAGGRYRLSVSSPGANEENYFQILKAGHSKDTSLIKINYNQDNAVYTTSVNGGTSWNTEATADISGYRFTISSGYSTSGEFISVPFDTGSTNTIFNYLAWQADIPAVTMLQFQLRFADNQANLKTASWTGPDGDTNTFYTTAGESITVPAAADGSRWVQYRAIFLSDGSETPILHEITTSYEI